MRWAIVAAVIAAVTAAVAANALLLNYGTDHNDPVGQLSPVARIPVAHIPASTTAPAPTTTTSDHGGGHGADD